MPAAERANLLARETSPYLLEHAHNPVDWRPWGEAAFSQARREDKPLFLSIGYSACHWCHVMARECFEDEQVASRLNRDFISVKVDREERPDIDGVYQRACQALSRGGGWPLSVFLDADGTPFFAGTYFPREAFLSLLDAAANAWRTDRAALLQGGRQLVEAISESALASRPAERAPITAAVAQFRRTFDPEYGGFGVAPKFPSPHNLLFLLRAAPELAEKTLESMYRGGIFDHVGGGFSRYSTDRYWLVPHFEKMLYDNALLSLTYLVAYESTGRAFLRRAAERTLAYLTDEMRAPDGGFYASQDADAGGAEGAYYVYTPEELAALLGAEGGGRFCARYGITAKGNFEGKNVPNLLGAPLDDPKVDALLPRVYDYRKSRMRLRTDGKRLTAWNALAIAAFAAAYRVLGNESYLAVAEDTAAFAERALIDGAALYAGFTGGSRSGPGFLDDYAFYVFALLQLHQATLEERYLARAGELADQAWTLFWDESAGGFLFSGTRNETLVARVKEVFDNAMPSGNSTMAYNLSRLALLTGEARFAARSARQNLFLNGVSASYPMGCAFYLWSALPVKKVVCAAKDESALHTVRARSDWAFRAGIGPDYPLVNDETTYYVCEDGVCRPPTNRLPDD